MPSRKEFYLFSQKRKRVITIGSIEYVMLCKSHVRSGFENPFFQRISLKSILGILSTNNPVSKVLSLRPSAQGPRPRALGPGPSAQGPRPRPWDRVISTSFQQSICHISEMLKTYFKLYSIFALIHENYTHVHMFLLI